MQAYSRPLSHQPRHANSSTFLPRRPHEHEIIFLLQQRIVALEGELSQALQERDIARRSSLFLLDKLSSEAASQPVFGSAVPPTAFAPLTHLPRSAPRSCGLPSYASTDEISDLLTDPAEPNLEGIPSLSPSSSVNSSISENTLRSTPEAFSTPTHASRRVSERETLLIETVTEPGKDQGAVGLNSVSHRECRQQLPYITYEHRGVCDATLQGCRNEDEDDKTEILELSEELANHHLNLAQPSRTLTATAPEKRFRTVAPPPCLESSRRKLDYVDLDKPSGPPSFVLPVIAIQPGRAQRQVRCWSCRVQFESANALHVHLPDCKSRYPASPEANRLQPSKDSREGEVLVVQPSPREEILTACRTAQYTAAARNGMDSLVAVSGANSGLGISGLDTASPGMDSSRWAAYNATTTSPRSLSGRFEHTSEGSPVRNLSPLRPFDREPVPGYFEYGISYSPLLNEQDIFRTVVIAGLPSGISLGEVLEKVCGGQLVSAKLLNTRPLTGTPTALIVFFSQDSAEAFTKYANDKKLEYRSQRVTVTHLKTATWPLSEPTRDGIINQNYSRCLRVRALERKDVDDAVDIRKRDMPYPGFDMTVSVHNAGKGVVEIAFQSVETAVKVFKRFSLRQDAGIYQMSFLRDPCDVPIPSHVEEVLDY